MKKVFTLIIRSSVKMTVENGIRFCPSIFHLLNNLKLSGLSDASSFSS